MSNHSVEETIFENKELKSSPSGSSTDLEHHCREFLAMPTKRVRTLSE